MRGLFVGRFQPPHRGHFEVVKWMFESLSLDEVIIVVGSAQESHTLRNPFTAGERIEMLRRGLREYGLSLDRVVIVPVHDIEMNFVWVRFVEMHVPRFDVVVTRNPLVARLFREYGYRVVEPPAFERERLSATYIREMMLAGVASWRSLVPRSVADYIDEIGGVERLVEVSRGD